MSNTEDHHASSAFERNKPPPFNLKLFLYDSKKHTILNRTGSSWGKKNLRTSQVILIKEKNDQIKIKTVFPFANIKTLWLCC